MPPSYQPVLSALRSPLTALQSPALSGLTVPRVEQSAQVSSHCREVAKAIIHGFPQPAVGNIEKNLLVLQTNKDFEKKREKRNRKKKKKIRNPTAGRGKKTILSAHRARVHVHKHVTHAHKHATAGN